jgi:hypothetical protein
MLENRLLVRIFEVMRKKVIGAGENCEIRSLIIYILHQILLE